MWQLIRSNVIAPLSTRIGTATAFFLGGKCVFQDYCFAQHDANTLGQAVTIGGLIVFDLVTAYLRKRSIQSKAIQSVTTAGGR